MRLSAARIFFGSLATKSDCSFAQLSNWLSQRLALWPFSPLKASGLLITSLERLACKAAVTEARLSIKLLNWVASMIGSGATGGGGGDTAIGDGVGLAMGEVSGEAGRVTAGEAAGEAREMGSSTDSGSGDTRYSDLWKVTVLGCRPVRDSGLDMEGDGVAERECRPTRDAVLDTGSAGGGTGCETGIK